MWPNVSDDPAIQECYERLRADGVSHNLAEIFAFQRSPSSRTDREFLHGHCNGSQFVGDEERGDFYRKEAKKAGVSTTGKVYLSGLAERPGDPRAWISDRHDVQKVIEERGWNCEGAVNVRTPQREEPKKEKMADGLVAKYANEAIAANASLKTKRKEEIREMIVDKHGAK